MISKILVDNSSRRRRQKKLDIRVIIGNPPYSVGQGSANDNNQNVSYPGLDRRIADTYVAKSSAMLSKGVYDAYVRSIRWASDRIGKSGVVGFVTNAGFVEANAMSGLRKCLAEEFSDLYVFHLRGNARTSGEQRRKEKGNVFGEGSRAPVAISVLVKNPASTESGRIHFHDIGDYLNREEKLAKVAEFGSIRGIREKNGWSRISPDAHGDWIGQRDEGFEKYIPLGNKKCDGVKLFDNFSLGVVTNRDNWCYNHSKVNLTSNMGRMIAFYNEEVAKFSALAASLDKKGREGLVDKTIDCNPTKISWTRALKQDLCKLKTYGFEGSSLIKSLYRPYSKQWMYYNRRFNEMVCQMPRIFPDGEAENLVIQINSKYSGVGQIALASDSLPDLHCNGDSQCFPLYLYEDSEAGGDGSPDLFGGVAKTGRTRRDGISDEGLAHFCAAYPGESITKEDVFHYIYGLLHSPEYREKYADNLSKELPRIPCVEGIGRFRAFEKAGRDLAKLHVGYEDAEPYPLDVEITGGDSPSAYRVEKMRFGKTKADGKTADDKTVIQYNSHITIRGIPLEAYEYVVNGKSAIDWVMERQCVKTDKDSGIENDANKWATETVGNPKYPLELIQQVVTVSLETMKIVRGLPKLEIAITSC
jgi:predicted helicase